MAEMALIKYHYAYDESKQVININDVSSIERSKAFLLLRWLWS